MSDQPTTPAVPAQAPPGGLPGPVGPVGPPPAAADGQWHRVHPLTPALKFWQVLVVLLIFFGQEFGQGVVRGDQVPGMPDLGFARWASGGLVVLALLAVGSTLAYLSWRFTRYRVTHDALELQQGVLSRRQRQARLDRLQAVDIVQPLLARIVGLARLTLEVAGGGDSRIELAYLTEDQARRLRNHLLAAAAGLRYEAAEAPEAPERQVFSVPPQRLIGSLVLSGPAAALMLAVLAFGTAMLFLDQPGLMAGIVPAVIGVVGVLWARFATGFGFRIATAPDGLRLRHGLLEQRTQTVPPGRVQAIRLSQPLLWRRAGWWLVEANIAGYGPSTGDEGKSQPGLMLPVGTRDEAVTVLAFVLPDLGVEDEPPGLVVDAGLIGRGTDGGFTSAPRRARWVDPIGWNRQGFRVTSTALLLRRGALRRQLDVVPHARTQSCGVAQGPLQRRLGVASFALHSTPGPVQPTVDHLASHVAAGLLETQIGRARQARASAGPERWMERPGADAAPAAGAPQTSASGDLQQPAEPAE